MRFWWGKLPFLWGGLSCLLGCRSSLVGVVLTGLSLGSWCCWGGPLLALFPPTCSEFCKGERIYISSLSHSLTILSPRCPLEIGHHCSHSQRFGHGRFAFLLFYPFILIDLQFPAVSCVELVIRWGLGHNDSVCFTSISNRLLSPPASSLSPQPTRLSAIYITVLLTLLVCHPWPSSHFLGEGVLP